MRTRSQKAERRPETDRRSMRSSLTLRDSTARDCKAPPPPRPSSCPPRAGPARAGRQRARQRRHVPAPVKCDSSGFGRHGPGLERRTARGARATRPARAGPWLGRGPGARARAGARGEAGGGVAGRRPHSVPRGPGSCGLRAAARAGLEPREPAHACTARSQGLLQSHREQPRSAASDQGAGLADARAAASETDFPFPDRPAAG